MAGDWLKLFRNAQDSRVFSDERLWRIFCKCMMRANYSPRHFKGVKIEVGQFAFSYRNLAEELGYAVNTLRRSLAKLEEWECISIRVEQHFSVATVVNYKSYQNDSEKVGTACVHDVHRADTQVEREWNTSGTRVAQKEEGKEVKEVQEGQDTDRPDGEGAAQPPVGDPDDQSETKGENRGPEVREVFAHYRTYKPKSHPKPHAGMNEWVKIRARLGEGYVVDDLKAAIDGCFSSPFHQGENDRQRKFNSLELICRNSSKVDQFIELNNARGSPVLSERSMKNARAAENFLARLEDEDRQHDPE